MGDEGQASLHHGCHQGDPEVGHTYIPGQSGGEGGASHLGDEGQASLHHGCHQRDPEVGHTYIPGQRGGEGGGG
jgi:hypothetical protein